MRNSISSDSPQEQPSNVKADRFLPFEEAREYVRSLGLKNDAEWRKFYRSGQKPDNIPADPGKAYASQYQSLGDWLGTGTVANRKKTYWSFEQARAYVQSLGLKGVDEWRVYCKSEEKSVNIPTCPDRIYKDEWQGYGNFLGTNVTSTHNRQYLPFEEARVYARALKLKNHAEWIGYCASGLKPIDIPSAPYLIYKDQWSSIGDWLGTGNIANRYKLRTYEQKLAQSRTGNHRHHALKMTVLGTHTTEQIRDMLKRHRYQCYYCKIKFKKNPRYAYGYEFDIDHTFPLARVAGTSIPANDISYLVPACHPCNIKKRDRYPWEWPEGGRLL